MKTTKPDDAPVRRLDTWGEIASYLGVEVRTAQRWEKRMQLPVRRLDGGQAVYAFANDLDQWRAARERRPDPAAAGTAAVTHSDPNLAATRPVGSAAAPPIAQATKRLGIAWRRMAIGFAILGVLVLGVWATASWSSIRGLTHTEPDTFAIVSYSPAPSSVAFGGNVEPSWGVYVTIHYALRSHESGWLCIIAEVPPEAQSSSVCGDPVRLTRGLGTARTRVIVTNTTANGPVLTKRMRVIVASKNDCRPIPGNYNSHDASCFSDLFHEQLHDVDFAWTHSGALNRVGVLGVSQHAGATLSAETDVQVTVSYLLQDAPRASICVRPVIAAPLKTGSQPAVPAGPPFRCSDTEVHAGFGTATVSFAVSRDAALPVSTAGLWIEMTGLYAGYHPLLLNWAAPGRLR